MTDNKQQARDFLRSMYELTAEGDDLQKKTLLANLLVWEQPLKRILDEAHEEGRKARNQDEELLRRAEGAIRRISEEENGADCADAVPGPYRTQRRF